MSEKKSKVNMDGNSLLKMQSNIRSQMGLTTEIRNGYFIKHGKLNSYLIY